MDKDKKFTLDNETIASRPGGITFKRLIWFKHNMTEVSLLIALLALSVFLSISISFYFLCLTAITIFVNSWYWTRAKERFSADSNPGIIISESPALYAVYTDLTKGEGYYPAVKVETYKSKRKVKFGDKIATIAIYADGDGEESPAWSDFFPLPVEYATDNENELKRELARYDELAWENLSIAIQYIADNQSPGLYKIDSENSDW